MMCDKIKVLVVEDEFLAARLLTNNLERFFNYQVYGPVASGEDAIALAAADKPDIILMDMRLASAMSGIDAARQILAHQNIPILLLTGYTATEYAVQCRELGIMGILEKPLGPAEVDAAIKQALAKSGVA